MEDTVARTSTEMDCDRADTMLWMMTESFAHQK
jgi:hypothetical protein